MSQVAIFFIRTYQLIVSPLLHTATGPFVGCRYEISCSEYTIAMLRERGFIRGSAAGLKRLSTCHP